MVFQIQLQQFFPVTADQETAGQAQVLAIEHAHDIGHGNAELFHAHRVQVDPDGASLFPAKPDFPHTINGLKTLLDDIAGVLV